MISADGEGRWRPSDNSAPVESSIHSIRATDAVAARQQEAQFGGHRGGRQWFWQGPWLWHPSEHGRIVDFAPALDRFWPLGVSDGRYHRVKGLPLIDGVFVPDDRLGPVQLDSAGHAFDGFKNSEGTIFDYIWAGGSLPAPEYRTSTQLGGVDYGVSRNSVLSMTANKGITFDLEAIRRMHPTYRIRRFVAVAGKTEVDLGERQRAVDIRVFVDGQPRFSKLQVRTAPDEAPAPIPIRVELGDRIAS